MREPAEVLSVHISELDRFQNQPLYEAIVTRCRELNIAGATVFRGLEGYGETAELHRAHLVRSDAPIVVMIVDTAEKIAKLIPAVSEMIDTGLLTRTPAQIIRVEVAR